MSNTEQKQISRKNFLKGAGVSVAGVAMAGGIGALLTACTSPGSASIDTTGSTEKPQWPFKYVKLDPAVVEARAFKGYQEKGG